MMLIGAFIFAIAAGYFCKWGFGLNDQGVALFCLVVASSLLSGHEVMTVGGRAGDEIEHLKESIRTLHREVSELKERGNAP